MIGSAKSSIPFQMQPSVMGLRAVTLFSISVAGSLFRERKQRPGREPDGTFVEVIIAYPREKARAFRAKKQKNGGDENA